MNDLVGIYRALAKPEPRPGDITRGERLVDELIANGVQTRAIPAAAFLDELSQLREQLAAPLGTDEKVIVATTALRHHAVLAANDGVWFSPFAKAPFCHLAVGAELARINHEYRMHVRDVSTYGRVVDRMLRHLGEPAGPAGTLPYLTALRLKPVAFVLPSLLLTLPVSPFRYVPELLAVVEATSAGQLWDLPEWVSAAIDEVGATIPGISTARPPRADHGITVDTAQSLAEFEAAGLADDASARYAAFRPVVADLLRLHRAEIERACLTAVGSPEAEMLDLLDRKTPSARHAHGVARLGDELIDAHFDRMPEQSRALLDALAGSSWVEPGKPGESRMLTHLTALHGPMGKIFSVEDLAIIRRWIRDLGSAREGTAPIRTLAPLELTLKLAEDVTMPEPTRSRDFDGLRLRRLFHSLLTSAPRSETLIEADAFVEHWLEAAQHIEKPVFTWELPERYDEDEFPEWMQRTYEAMAAAPVTAVQDGGRNHRARSFQGAADNLVDGAWLQGLTRRSLESPAERLLYDIYWDEIGRGVVGSSHGVLYEGLLRSLGYDLPKFWTRQFAEHDGFLDEAFVAPVFRLAIAEFPESRLPEIVGVNMVCEFHGLGTAGMAKADDLSRLGYDTGFTRLHIADDNVELGHSAKSRDAVVFLMRHALQLGVADTTWSRVQRGAHAMRMAYVVLMQGRLNIPPTQIPADRLAPAAR